MYLPLCTIPYIYPHQTLLLLYFEFATEKNWIWVFQWIGEAFLAHNILTAQDVVIKLESLEASQPYLEHEYWVYQKLSRGIGIPCVHWFGTEGGFNVMVLNCLSESLEALFTCCNFKFMVQTVVLLTDQLLSHLKHIHSHNFIHHDLKPSNIMMGNGTQSNVVHLIDFGLLKEYRDPNTYEHIPCKTNLGLTGTATFASINGHLGLELGHHSLGFKDILDYGYISNLFKGLLSWEGFENVVTFDWDHANEEQPWDLVSNCQDIRSIDQHKCKQLPKQHEGKFDLGDQLVGLVVEDVMLISKLLAQSSWCLQLGLGTIGVTGTVDIEAFEVKVETSEVMVTMAVVAVVPHRVVVIFKLVLLPWSCRLGRVLE
ncbi:kinase-like domain-containing protein [Lactarius quietus]|nr:kinase-like domain-containing protein [Lactarius quietus]